MEGIIVILLIIISLLVKKILDLEEEKEIYHNNYINAMRALSDTDPSLKKYVEENKII